MSSTHAMYYDMDKIIYNLYQKSINGDKFNNLWRYIIKDKNILYAVKRISSNEGRNTAGPDGIIFDTIKYMDEKYIIKEVKKRLYRDIKPEGRTIHIPKDNGWTRKLGIQNLYDRISQQCILNILEPILEHDFVFSSYGFRKGRSGKACIGQLCTILKSIDIGHIYDCDLKSYFDLVSVDKVIDLLRKNHNIYDQTLLNCIASIMKPVIDGHKIKIGLPQGSVLGPILSNVMLHDFELLIQKLNGYNADLKYPYSTYKKFIMHYRQGGFEKMTKWAGSRRGIRMYRYADDFVLISNNPYDIYDGIMLLEEWCKEMGLNINKDKSRLITIKDNFELEFLGYKLRFKAKDNKISGDKRYVTISPKSFKQLWKKTRIALRKCYNRDKYIHSQRIQSVLMSYYYHYDICTNLYSYNQVVTDWLWKNQLDTGLTKVPGSQRYINKDISVSAWDLRSNTKTSYSQYIKSDTEWIPNTRDHLDNHSVELYDEIDRFMMSHNILTRGYKIFIPGLIKKQKQEPVLEQPLSRFNLDDLRVHHIKPRQMGGLTEFNNLVIVHKSVHEMIHGSDPKLYPYLHVNQTKLNKYRDKVGKKQ